MASTNKTTNYELSQFLETDKPAWLSDYNTDMSKIDAGMKDNADGVTAVSGVASANATAIGSLASLTTDVKTSLVGAVNEVDSHADTAQSVANSANTTASNANIKIDDLTDYLNLTTFQQIQSPTTTSGSFTSNGIYVARNDAGTVGKIYGYLGVDNISGNTFTVTLPNTGLSTSQDIVIQGLGLFQGDTTKSLFNVTTTIKSNGNVELSINKGSGDSAGFIRMFACLIFVKNFGDTPE